MKKKLVAVVALVLIVVLACSLAACNSKSMFDGRFNKEATKEEAASFWKTAQSAFGQESEELATASSEDKETVKGWKGMKVSMLGDSFYSSVDGDKKYESRETIELNGSTLFDGSAMAITAKFDGYETEDGKTEKETMVIGDYVKDKTMYAVYGNGEKELNVKIGADLGIVGSIIKKIVGNAAEGYSQMAVTALGAVICSMDYDAIAEYEGFKVYIDNSGKYNRVKYVLTAELLAALQGRNESVYKDAVLGECSIIIVIDKDGVFQGIKFETNTSITKTVGTQESKSTSKSVVSIEKCDEITSYPANLDDYKDVKDLKMEDLEGFDFN